MITAIILTAALLALATYAATRLRKAGHKVDAILEQELNKHPGDDGQFARWPSVRAPGV